jgi:SAM-dependent methyltransferase
MPEDEKYFETRLSFEPKRDAIWAVIVEYLQRYIPRDASVLELGAGYCSFINHVEAREKHALDRSAIIEKYADASVTTHISDCDRLNHFETSKFDVAFSSFLFEHLTRTKLNHVLTQLRRILKPGGVLITLLPNFKYISRHYFDDYTHVQIFSHISFSDYLVSRGFHIHTVQGRFLPYSFKSRLPQSPFLTRLYLSLPFRPLAGNMLVVATNPECTKPRMTRGEQNRETGGTRSAPDTERSRSRAKTAAGQRTDSKKPPTLKTGSKKDTPGHSPETNAFSGRSSPSTEIRHGRRARRSAADHYGVKSIPPTRDIGRADQEKDRPATSDTVEVFKINKKKSLSGDLSPSGLRNKKRRK